MGGNGFRVGVLLMAVILLSGVVFAPSRVAVAENLSVTDAPAYRVKDINTAAQPMVGMCGSGFAKMGELADGTLMLGLRTNDTGCELWRSDGTLTGTQPISTDVNLFGAVSGDAYFYSDGVNLYRSDLALTHTQTLKVLPASSQSDFLQFEAGASGQVFFLQLRRQLSAQNRPTDLWVSDGTPEGTRFIKTVSDFERSSFSYQMLYVNGLLYFVANPDGAGDELWRSDGTEAGTMRVRDIFPGAGSASPGELTALNGKVYFNVTDADGRRLLYVSDGSEVGTKPVRSDSDAPVEPLNLYATNGQLYFSAADVAHGRELWRSDGSTANTALLQDIAPGAVSSNPAFFVRAGNHLFFAATTLNEGQEMWAIAFPFQTYLPRLMR